MGRTLSPYTHKAAGGLATQRACINNYMYRCSYKSVCIYIQIRTRLYLYAHIHISAPIEIYMCICMCFMHTLIHMWMQK